MLNEIVEELMHELLENIITLAPTTYQQADTNTITPEQKMLLITCKYNEINIADPPPHSPRIKNDFCPLYQNKFLKDSMVTILPCGHCFSTEPILFWLETKKAECPLCKYNFPI